MPQTDKMFLPDHATAIKFQMQTPSEGIMLAFPYADPRVCILAPMQSLCRSQGMHVCTCAELQRSMRLCMPQCGTHNNVAQQALLWLVQNWGLDMAWPSHCGRQALKFEQTCFWTSVDNLSDCLYVGLSGHRGAPSPIHRGSAIACACRTPIYCS